MSAGAYTTTEQQRRVAAAYDAYTRARAARSMRSLLDGRMAAVCLPVTLRQRALLALGERIRRAFWVCR